MGAIIGFLITVVLTTVWPQAAAPKTPTATGDGNQVVHVTTLVPAGQAALPAAAQPARALRRPTRFVNPQHAMPVATP